MGKQMRRLRIYFIVHCYVQDGAIQSVFAYAVTSDRHEAVRACLTVEDPLEIRVRIEKMREIT